MKPETRILFLLSCILFLAACSVSPSEPEQPEAKGVPFRITIPVEEAATRTIGDPGVKPPINLPNHAYFFWAAYTSLDAANSSTGGEYEYEHIPLDATKWVYDEALSTATNSIIYTYETRRERFIETKYKVVRVYVALSNDKLFSIDPTITDETTETDIRNLTFDIPNKFIVSYKATDQLEDFLKNLYTTPYNHLHSGKLGPYAVFNDKYYGTLKYGDVILSTNLICYHAAAKLDVMWNVEETAQAAKKVVSMEATELYNTNCSLFNPTNTGNTAIDGNYTESFGSITIGNQWYGRHAIYVIQKPANAENKATYNFNVGLKNNNTDETISAEANVEYVNTAFTPWMRGTITIK